MRQLVDWRGERPGGDLPHSGRKAALPGDWPDGRFCGAVPPSTSTRSADSDAVPGSKPPGRSAPDTNRGHGSSARQQTRPHPRPAPRYRLPQAAQAQHHFRLRFIRRWRSGIHHPAGIRETCERNEHRQHPTTRHAHSTPDVTTTRCRELQRRYYTRYEAAANLTPAPPGPGRITRSSSTVAKPDQPPCRAAHQRR